LPQMRWAVASLSRPSNCHSHSRCKSFPEAERFIRQENHKNVLEK
jgi:hypothetical protein